MLLRLDDPVNSKFVLISSYVFASPDVFPPMGIVDELLSSALGTLGESWIRPGAGGGSGDWSWISSQSDFQAICQKWSQGGMDALDSVRLALTTTKNTGLAARPHPLTSEPDTGPVLVSASEAAGKRKRNGPAGRPPRRDEPEYVRPPFLPHWSTVRCPISKEQAGMDRWLIPT